MVTSTHLADLLVRIRWPQRELARWLGVQEGMVRSVLSGRRRMPPEWTERLRPVERAAKCLERAEVT